jgi:very-short-patch-repair endonuclease
MRFRNTSPELEAVARAMRASMTSSERTLWANLKSRRLGGARFRAQHALGPIVLDFVCCRARLVVEVDGPYHEAQAQKDRERDEHLASVGYRVLRFSNNDVDNDITRVLATITSALQASPGFGGAPRHSVRELGEGAVSAHQGTAE